MPGRSEALLEESKVGRIHKATEGFCGLSQVGPEGADGTVVTGMTPEAAAPQATAGCDGESHAAQPLQTCLQRRK